MSLINNRVSLLVTAVYLSSSLVNAQTTGFTTSATNRISSPTIGFSSQMSQQRVLAIKTSLEGFSAGKSLEPTTVESLVNAYQKNTSIKRELDTLINQSTFSKDPQTLEIIRMKIELLSLISHLNLDELTVERAGMNREIMAQFIVSSLVSKLKVQELTSEKGKANSLQILEEIYNCLNITSANFEKALENALVLFNADTGLSLSMEEMFAAIQNDIHNAHSNERKSGLTDIFKSDNDRRNMTIGEGIGALEIQVSKIEAEKITFQAQEKLSKLINVAYGNDPRNEANRLVSSQTRLKAENYITNTHLLERTEESIRLATSKHDAGVKTYDDLLKYFRDLGDIIDGNKAVGMAERFFTKGVGKHIPFVGNKLAEINDSQLKRKTVEQKIALARQALHDGAKQIEKDNSTLETLRIEIAKYSVDLQKKIAELKIMSNLLVEYIKTLETTEGSDSKIVKVLKGVIGLAIETELDAALAVNSTLIRSQAQIEGLITVGIGTVNLSRVVDNEIFPMLRLQEGLMGVAALQQAQISKLQAIKSLREKREEALVEEMEKVYKNSAKLLGSSFDDPKKREELDKRLSKARTEFEQARITANEKKRILNSKQIDAQNRAQRAFSGNGENLTVNKILNEGQ